MSTACSEDDPTPDASVDSGVRADAAAKPDALVDTGVPDAGDDAGRPDTGAPDANDPADTGAPDLGVPDTGAPDTGPRDTGFMGEPDTGGHPDATPDAEVFEDAAEPDAGDEPDAGEPDSGPPDVGPFDTGPIVGACPCTFTEEFADATRLDPGATTASIDPSGTGAVIAAAPLTFAPLGLGLAGVYAPPGNDTLAAGTYDFTTFTISSGNSTFVPGNLTVSTTGDFRVENGSLAVAGHLTILAGGEVVIDCSGVSATGDITIQAPGTAGIQIDCALAAPGARVFTDSTSITGGDSGDITMWTRGAITLGNYAMVTTGECGDASGHTGSIELRAYGDVSIGRQTLVGTRDSWGVNGDLSIATEGDLVIHGASNVTAGLSRGLVHAGGTVRLNAAGNVEVHDVSYVTSSPAGDVRITSANEVLVDGDANVSTRRNGTTPTTIAIRGRAVRLSGGSNPNGGGFIIAAESLAGGGRIVVDARELISLRDGSFVGISDTECTPGGDITLRSGGVIEILDFSSLDAGSSYLGTGCSAGAGGHIVQRATGLITIGPFAFLSAGDGTPMGTITTTPSDATYVFGVLDAQLVTRAVATSIGLPLESNVARTVTGYTFGPTVPALGVEAALALAPDGQTWVDPAPLLVLDPGWRYRVTITPRMFDAVGVDALTVDYQ
ncbi:hypothetical protein L6R52_33180 [Myxococcota bacterium]|nr:hypothetical protein [Myxococcota bacterium]